MLFGVVQPVSCAACAYEALELIDFYPGYFFDLERAIRLVFSRCTRPTLLKLLGIVSEKKERLKTPTPKSIDILCLSP